MTIFAHLLIYNNHPKAVQNLKQVIYIDVLIFLNTIITFLLLLASSRLIKIYPTPGRLTLSSLLGGIESLIILAPDLGFLISLLTKLLFSLIIVISAYNPKSLSVMLKETGYFFVVNFIFAGMMLFASSLPGISIVNYNNGAVYINFSFFSLIAACIICYITTCLLGKITKHKAVDTVVYNIEIESDGKTINTSAILDTGNSLTDPFTGKSVIIADRFTLSEILPQNIKTYLATGNCEQGIKIIPCKTITASTLIPCFRADKIRISGNNTCIAITDCEIAVSNQSLTEVILPSAIFNENERRKENGALAT